MASITVACDLNSINKGGKCFNCLSQIEEQAAIVYFLNRRLGQLNGLGASTPAALRKSAACFCNGRGVDPVADGFDAWVAQQGAQAAGDSGAGLLTIAQIRGNILPLAKMTLAELRVIEIILRCQLNAFP